MGATPLSRLYAVPNALLQVLTAARQLHPKQLALLDFLNRHRDPQLLHQTLPLSYTRLHEGTGISIDHIRRNALHRLLRNGLISVVMQTFAGTVYHVRFDQTTIQDVLTHLRHNVGESLPPPSALLPLTEPSDFAALQKQIDLLHHLHHQRQTLRRDEFAASLTPAQLHWLAARAKHDVDTQGGIRFVKDRFPQYEATRIALLDEWMLRQQYGEQVPSALAPEDIPPCPGHQELFAQGLSV